MTCFTTLQKGDLEHYIINMLSKPEMARLLKVVKYSKEDIISMPKKDASLILNCLYNIRNFILSLPEEGKNDKI